MPLILSDTTRWPASTAVAPATSISRYPSPASLVVVTLQAPVSLGSGSPVVRKSSVTCSPLVALSWETR